MQNPARRDVLTGEAIETRPVEPVPLTSAQQGMPPSAADLVAEAVQSKQVRRDCMDAATIGFAQPGQMQAERDFNQQGEGSSPVRVENRFGRNATKWFSFDLPVDPTHPLTFNHYLQQ